MPRTKATKRPNWKTANSSKTLKKMGLDKADYRKTNQRIASHLINQGFEFWGDCCIGDYTDFDGYTLIFRKTAERGDRIWFSWRWVDDESIYWQGEMRSTFSLSPELQTHHPYFSSKVTYITDWSLHLTQYYEDFLVRSLLTAGDEIQAVKLSKEAI